MQFIRQIFFRYFDCEQLGNKFHRHMHLHDYTYHLHIQLAKLLQILNSNWISNLMSTFFRWFLLFRSSLGLFEFESNVKTVDFLWFLGLSLSICQVSHGALDGPHDFRWNFFFVILFFCTTHNKRIICPMASDECAESFWIEQYLV